MSPQPDTPCPMCDAFRAVKAGMWTKHTLFAFGVMMGRKFTESRVAANLCPEHTPTFNRGCGTAITHIETLNLKEGI